MPCPRTDHSPDCPVTAGSSAPCRCWPGWWRKTPAGDDRDLASGARSQNFPDAVAEVIGVFHFDAVLAAVKAARGDVLIGAHLTLQLARHILVIAMLRDRDAGTAHHRFGGSRWDTWASRLARAPAPYTRGGGVWKRRRGPATCPWLARLTRARPRQQPVAARSQRAERVPGGGELRVLQPGPGARQRQRL
jgi:hypothetical protein